MIFALIVVVIAVALLWLAHVLVVFVTTHHVRSPQEIRDDIRADNLAVLHQRWFR